MDDGHDNPELQQLLVRHMLYTFIVAAMAVAVPLYLVDRDVDITWIGIILSVGPLSFMVIRILLASMADEIGTKAISAIYSASNLASFMLYLLVVSPLGFAVATLAEGARASGFWAIARTEVFERLKGADPGTALTRFSNMRQLADGLGRLAIGFLLAYLAFEGAFEFLLLLSLVLAALIMWPHTKGARTPGLGKHNLQRISKQRPPTFWHAAILQLLVWLPYNMLIGFVIPIYLITSLKMGYAEVGLILALMSIATAVFALLFMKMHLSKRTVLLLTLLSVPALVLIPFGAHEALPLLALVALGMGCGNIIGEYLLVDQVFRSKDVSTDIGVLYSPLKIAEFLFLSMGGLLVANFGFAPLFIVLSLSLLLFVAFGRAVISAEPAG